MDQPRLEEEAEREFFANIIWFLPILDLRISMAWLSFFFALETKSINRHSFLHVGDSL